MCNCKLSEVKVLFSRENSSVIIPSKRDEDGGADLYIDFDWLQRNHNGILKIKQQETVMIPTGLRSIMEPGWYAQIQERGSTGTKGMKYGAGVIDQGFTGVWNVVLTNCNEKEIHIYSDYYEQTESLEEGVINYPASKGIAQFVMLPVPKLKIKEVSKEEVLAHKTMRGEGKLGSSGK